MEVIVGIDIGTGSMKAIAFDPINLQPVSTHQEHYITLGNGQIQEEDPNEIFSHFIKAFTILQNKLTKYKIIAVTFSSAMHSLIVIDQKGKAITNCLLWSDSRSFEQARQLQNRDIGTKIYEHTGTPIHSMSPLCKIAFFKEKEKPTYQRAAKYISIKAYIIYRLFGKLIEDHSIASATGLFDINRFEWYQPALEYVAIGPDNLPQPVPTNFTFTGLRQNWVKILRLPANTPFIIGGADGPLANLGALSLDRHEGCITIGTSGAIRITSNKNMVDKTKSLFSYILDENYYVVGGAVNNGGIILKWLQSVFVSNNKDQNNYKEIFKSLEQVSAGCDGLICLPWLFGERAPVWDASVKGMFIGLTHQHSNTHFLRAGVEGILYNINNVLEIIEALTQDIKIINFNGGLAKNPAIVQLLSDISNKRIRTNTQTDASTMGAIFIAMKALGIIHEYTDLLKYKSSDDLVAPDSNSHQIYKTNFNIFKNIIKNHNVFY